VGVAALLAAMPASAQEGRPSGGPFTGLFRGSPRDQPHSLDVRASGFAAWDDNPINQAPNGSTDPFAIDPRFLKEGIAGGFIGSLTYGFHKTGTRTLFNVSASASLQEFASGAGSGILLFHSYAGSTGVTTKLTGRTSVSFGVGAAYAPYYQYAPFLRSTTSEESPVGTDYGFAVDSVWIRSTTASGALSHRLTKRSTITGNVGLEKREIPGNEDFNTDQRSAGVSFNHALTRKLAFHVGYSVQEARYKLTPGGQPVRSQGMDVGLNYGDGLVLQLGRHTTLSFNVGAAVAKNGDPISVATTGKSTAVVVNGSATLSRSIGRSWGASLGYLRDTSYQVGFAEPILSESLNAGIGGMLTSRLNVSAGAGASRGQRLFTESTGDLISYGASTHLGYAMFRHLALYAQASYYKFSIPPNFTTFGFVPKLDRRTVSVGLTTWLPLIKPPRARRDSGAPPTTGQP